MPMPSVVMPGERPIASAPTSARRATTASGPPSAGVGTWSRSMHPPVGGLAFDDHPLDVRAPEVEAEMAADGQAAARVHQVSPVTRV